MRTRTIPFARPTVGKEERRAAMRVLRSGWLTSGEEVEKFEQEFRIITGASHALAVSSATAGLHLTLRACGVKKGMRVAMSPYTFVATAETLHYLGATPLFIDIEPDTFNISPQSLEHALASSQSFQEPIYAIMPIHIGGYYCDMDRIAQLAQQYQCHIIEDAAHCHPIRQERLHGDAVYSFYATKPITTGEGGMIITNNDERAALISTLRTHGIDRTVWNRYRDRHASWQYSVVENGYKYNLPDLLASIGRAQLQKANRLWKYRHAIASRYNAAFADLEWMEIPPHTAPHSWHLYLISLNLDMLTIDRDKFISLLQEKGIGVSVHYIPLHLMPWYQKQYRLSPHHFPHATNRFYRTLSLPIYPSLSRSQGDYIIQTVRKIGARHLR